MTGSTNKGANGPIILKKQLSPALIVSAFITITASFNGSAEEHNSANTDKYDASYFMVYEPQTVYDVLENIPGVNSVLVAMNNSTDNRGFGSSGDQILLNGKRVSGKENDIRNELDTIQAQDVDYIELIRGTQSGLDVQSKGLIVNVVLKKNIESSLLWSAATIKTSATEAKPEVSLIYSASDSNLKYRLGFSHDMNPTKISMFDTNYSRENQITDKNTHIRKTWFKKNQLSAKVEYQFSEQTSAQMNALYNMVYLDGNRKSTLQNLAQNSQAITEILYDWGKDDWELSGDIVHQIDNENLIKLLFISTHTDANDQTHQLLLDDNDAEIADYDLPRLYKASEYVLRGNWQHQINQYHSLDTGVETAINSLDENIQFIKFGESAYQTIENNDIEENRYEAFINYNYALSSALNIQASLVYERSIMDVTTHFTLVNDVGYDDETSSSRTFNYLKPRFNVRYDINDEIQVRANYERTVSQLDLYDFVPTFNYDDHRLEETNPNLKPEMRDEVSFSIEKQWLATEGSITLTPYYHKIRDLITEVPLVTYSGDGNIDNAREYGVTLDTSFGLDVIGLSDTQISASYTWRDSKAINPFTGKNDVIEKLSDNEWRIKLTQNDLLPNVSFSLSVDNISPYPYSRNDLKGTLRNEPKAKGYIDYQLSKTLKLRLQGDYLLGYKSSYKRERHAGLYTETDIVRYERRNYERAPRFTLSLNGQF